MHPVFSTWTLTKVIIGHRWLDINIQNARNRMILYKIGCEVIEYITKGSTMLKKTGSYKHVRANSVSKYSICKELQRTNCWCKANLLSQTDHVWLHENMSDLNIHCMWLRLIYCTLYFNNLTLTEVFCVCVCVCLVQGLQIMVARIYWRFTEYS